jgi:hypothetical protein
MLSRRAHGLDALLDVGARLLERQHDDLTGGAERASPGRTTCLQRGSSIPGSNDGLIRTRVTVLNQRDETVMTYYALGQVRTRNTVPEGT